MNADLPESHTTTSVSSGFLRKKFSLAQTHNNTDEHCDHYGGALDKRSLTELPPLPSTAAARERTVGTRSVESEGEHFPDRQKGKEVTHVKNHSKAEKERQRLKELEDEIALATGDLQHIRAQLVKLQM